MGISVTFDHTADLGLKIFAADLDDLFGTAAEALFDVIVSNRDQIMPRETVEFQLTADSTEALLFEWLNELIFGFETRHIVLGRFEVRVDSETHSLTAKAHGEPLDHARHAVDHEVKAVTHHGALLIHDQDGWRAELILDI